MSALIESKKSPNLLVGDIQQYAVKKSQEESDRRQDIIHPSEMAKEDWCPRQTTYRLRGVAPSDTGQVFGYQMLTIFQEGHDIHSKWQTWLMEMGRLWGRYECPLCGHSDFGVGPLPCTECSPWAGAPITMDYKEVPLDGEGPWMIAGHADGAVPDIDAFIEIKSIGLGTVRMEEPALVRNHTVKTVDGDSVVDYDSLFKAIKRPFKSHRKQAAIYLAIARHLGWPYKRMVFIYENKANQQVREFVVPFDEDLANELIDVAKDIKWAVENDVDLPRPVGLTPDKKPCKECPWKTWCWSGEDSSEQDRGEEPNAADGAGVPRSQAQVGSAEDRPTSQAGGRVPRVARGSHGTVRQRADEDVRPADEVGGVPERAVGGGGGGRKVRRRITGAGAGDQGL